MMSDKQQSNQVSKHDGRNASLQEPQPQVSATQEQKNQEQKSQEQKSQEQQKSREQQQQAQATRTPPPISAIPSIRRGQQQGLGRTPGYVSPFSLIRRMAEEMDSILDQLGSPRMSAMFAPSSQFEEAQSWIPQVEVVERDGELVVRADLPGMDVDDVRVTVAEDELTIEGERRYEHEDFGESVHQSERSYGSFERTIPLPEGIDTENVTAKFDNGVLEITLKSSPPKARGRQVEITGSQSQSESPKTENQKKS